MKTEDCEAEDISGWAIWGCEVSDEVLSKMPMPNVTETSQVKSSKTAQLSL